jgi:hypothetical protein
VDRCSGHGRDSHTFPQLECGHTYVEDQIHTFHITASVSHEFQAKLHLHRQFEVLLHSYCKDDRKYIMQREFPETVREHYPKKCRKSINKLPRLCTNKNND